MPQYDYIRTLEEMEADDREKCIIDVRGEEDFKRETYEGSIHIYWEEFGEHREELPKDQPIYLICYSGQQSDSIAQDFAEEGYEIYSIKGGYGSVMRRQMKEMLQEQENGQDIAKDVERSIVKKFRKDIWRKFTKAINAYDLIQDGDKIAVCISGGKDSMLMAKLFQELQRHGKKNFDVVYLVMNPGYNDVNYQRILTNASIMDVPITVFESKIYDIVADIDANPCYLCARMRRGYLYSKAKELGCNKIALGHHFDDVIETIMMGMLYGAQMQTMMPKLHSTNFEGMELIRPMYLIRERDIIHWREYNHLKFIACACRLTDSCSTTGEETGSKRAEVKQLIKQLEDRDPVIAMNIFRSVENVNLSTVIQYKDKDGKHHFLDTYDEQ
ncbi:tRNA(Ile)-lysidine synthase TilS/MesJ [Lachnospiraceae bacterium A10]|nr:tRNA(Ile)-lysidine synthase TilS/MesJ [Lachnospiraceae bacterium A10]